MQTDTLFYHLFKTIPDLFFEIAKLDYSPKAYQFNSVEVKQVAFRLDGLFKPPATKLNLPLIFVEVQFQKDEHFYARFFSEIFLYLKQHPQKHDWKAVVIFKNKTVDNGKTQHYEMLLNSPNVSRIYLSDFKTETDNFYLQLIQMITGSKKKSIILAKKLVSQTQELDLIETIMVYKFSKLSREEIRKMIDISTVDMTQTRFYREAILEGIEIGEQKGEFKFFYKLLEKRFGSLPENIVQRLKQANENTLDIWGDAFLTAQTLDDVFTKTND